MDLTELHARLARAAERCYPEQARRFRREGVSTVVFCLDPQGRPTEVTVRASSGVAALDAAATGCVVPGAAPFPPLPGCYRLPVRFGPR
jgi:TonB family protein